jgi:hypothetical protein
LLDLWPVGSEVDAVGTQFVLAVPDDEVGAGFVEIRVEE